MDFDRERDSLFASGAGLPSAKRSFQLFRGSHTVAVGHSRPQTEGECGEKDFRRQHRFRDKTVAAGIERFVS